jgi:hypothetical protein
MGRDSVKYRLCMDDGGVIYICLYLCACELCVVVREGKQRLAAIVRGFCGQISGPRLSRVPYITPEARELSVDRGV